MSELIKVGRISDLTETDITTFSATNGEIAITKIGEKIFAVENMCSHARCKLSEGLIEDKTIACPCHGASFDLHTGEPLNPPAKKPIKCFEVKVEGEDLYIKL
ncbi:non-heme iron oxygenase ferredoxin subunit [Peribacillus cavernae]|uniref:Non-heme iron oxygenase ferredoxin subunit n=1 Tax=Peribacillus cavernae TaxID=1674310 RepID=A0A3S0W9U2_9BACI|nr:non-heme iron oxygenase ferredoxin subunit [Peribacillus cavernae]MDQ0218679.1 nitrite reductase/ring-hydroxylating ferredoxin subunit [Peribacillus cavernae]RUQ30900.1 non-heme iron oxygenase ferredoxin subunit [Peribacillus cavernae]